MKSLLNDNVLVLNRLWQAINICTAQRAFTLLCCGHAEVVLEDNGDFKQYDLMEWADESRGYTGDDVVHSARHAFRVPRVILLLFFDRLPNKEVKFTRHNIYERDGHRCQYCGKKFDKKLLNFDHVIPRDMGGSTTWENIVCACIDCNTRKQNRTPAQAGMKLLKKPKRPKWRPFVNVSVKDIYRPEWSHFMDLAMWAPVELTGVETK
jgi:5-methylcytosine-specific restriction endonuclease McrA